MKKISKRRFFLFSILFPFAFFRPAWSHPNKPNLLVVWKKKRVLALYRNSNMIKAYRIRLGFNPKGQKQKEGDGKTPEGKYYITHKNPNSKFYLSLGINFPNQFDKKRALNKGLNPGSDIFIHGLGAIGWSIAGLITKDRALMTNFGLQIPLFVIGYTYYLS